MHLFEMFRWILILFFVTILHYSSSLFYRSSELFSVVEKDIFIDNDETNFCEHIKIHMIHQRLFTKALVNNVRSAAVGSLY